MSLTAQSERATNASRASPRSVYVHVPFCRHRCGYCNFTLIANRDDLIGRYLDALRREFAGLPKCSTVDTIFVGGGTPTHLSRLQSEELLKLIAEYFALSAGGEYSFEANPHDVTEEKAALLADYGVTRLSLGAQSFDPEKLRLLERDHDARQIKEATRLAARYFHSYSLDLIFGAPHESLKAWSDDLRKAIELQPTHVSTYGLTIEKGTQFWNQVTKGKLTEVEEDQSAEMYELAIDRLTEAGFEHYEVSNFAAPNQRCRHNEAYWTGKAFYGLGAGATSFIDGRRATNHRSTSTYIKRVLAGESPVAEQERLPPENAARERLVFGLRRLQGINLAEFGRDTGYTVWELAGAEIKNFIAAGFLEENGQSLRLTRRGLLISDSLWPALL